MPSQSSQQALVTEEAAGYSRCAANAATCKLERCCAVAIVMLCRAETQAQAQESSQVVVDLRQPPPADHSGQDVEAAIPFIDTVMLLRSTCTILHMSDVMTSN